MKTLISKTLEKSLKELKIKLSPEEIDSLIEIPPSTEMGDFAFPCFSLSKTLKLNPSDIALELRKKIGNPPEGLQVETQGPYVNFFVDRKSLAENLIKEINEKADSFGNSNIPQKVMVEFPSPNTNKPLHLGHLRNMAIGESVSRILEFSGSRVIRTNLNNDRGIHICKSMLAYQKWGKNKKPTKTKKSDHLVGDFYVMFSKKAKQSEKLEKEAHELLRKWEAGDKETLELWKKMNQWALDGFNETYKKFGIWHDKEYYESQIYDKGKEIILQGVKDKIFTQNEDGSVSIDLEDKGLGKKYLLRSDGTTIYMTQDIYLAKLKLDEFQIDKSIYLTGNEQDYHFQVLFHLLDKLKLVEKKNLHHLSYGMVMLPEGRMKSREGTVVDADDLIEEIKKLVQKELKKRDKKISKKAIEERSLKITLAAIKYYLLKTDIKKNIVFHPKESISFEGDTGPYLLYSYARANSIIEKSKQKNLKFKIESLDQSEINLIKKLEEFKSVVQKSSENLNPSYLANYSFQLAQIFNEFYHSCPVIGSEKEDFRLALVISFKQVLKNSLTLLGIEVLEKM